MITFLPPSHPFLCECNTGNPTHSFSLADYNLSLERSPICHMLALADFVPCTARASLMTFNLWTNIEMLYGVGQGGGLAPAACADQARRDAAAARLRPAVPEGPLLRGVCL